jgi:uncharacterized protein (DUF4415 family)
MREYMAGAFDGLNPFNSFEEMSKQQLAMFERAVKMFSPFYSDEAVEERSGARAAPQADKQIDELRARLNEMQRQLDALVSERGGGEDRPSEAKTESHEPAGDDHDKMAPTEGSESGPQRARAGK